MHAAFTDDRVCADAPAQERTTDEILTYLRANPRHAVVLNSRVFVARDASDETYFASPWPGEDPGDAFALNSTAEDALAEAIAAL